LWLICRRASFVEAHALAQSALTRSEIHLALTFAESSGGNNLQSTVYSI
jgi:hypothetical protein